MTDSPPGLDLDKLVPWLRERVAPVDALEAEVIGHGRSNITYRVHSGAESWVVRRPPLSHVQPTAHDMSREFRVISALRDTDVPVPETFALCNDPDVIGAPFYVMSFVEGIVPVDPAKVQSTFDEAQRHTLGEELIDVLAALHAIDPASIGLGDFGKPQGYIERQVRRFSEQLANAKTRELPELD